MGILYDDVVILKQSEKEGDPTVITINCPDKTGLGCDLCRIILFFGLNIVRGDMSTDGKWCYIVFWVVGKSTTRWGLLKKRLVEACPSYSSAFRISFYYQPESRQPGPPDVFLLKFCCHDRPGLLHDVTEVLCELELTIKKVKISTMPDGRVMDLFFITDSRELLHTNKRQEDTCYHIKDVLGDATISCDIEMVGPEVTACSQASNFLSSVITEEVFSSDKCDGNHSGSITSKSISILMDNCLSPSHTLVQIVCQDHKGLLYDIMRTLKDYNIQVLDCYSQLLMEMSRTHIPCIIPDCAFSVLLLDDYKSFLDYAKKHGKKTSQEDAVRGYYSTKARSALLKILSDHLTVRWLGLDATKVDNLFIIVHLLEAKHWILAQVDRKESLVTIYDSIRLKHDKYQRHRNALSAHLPRIIYMMNQDAGKIQKFKILDGKDVPRQGPTNDCGVFVAKFAESIIFGRAVSDISQDKMSEYRKGIGYSLLEFCEGNR